MTEPGEVLWKPAERAGRPSQVATFADWLDTHRGLRFAGYQALWEWSTTDLDGFWAAVWDYFEIRSSTPYETVLADRAMPGARWFPGARLNYAEHVLAGARRARHPDGAALVSLSQTRADRTSTADELTELVARARTGLRRLGVGAGDRVAAYLPSLPETVAAYLACLSLGAVWCSCAPEFGTRSVLDRLGQVQPSVLFVVDGYRFGDRPVDRTDEVAEIRAALPSVRAVVALPYLYPDEHRIPDAVAWSELVAEIEPLAFEQVPFEHPVHILFSSGTTGLPKPIVHGHGGVLLDQLKSMTFHQNLGADDRLFFFSTTGWMAWNWLVSALAGATSIVLADGNLLHPDLAAPWRAVAEHGITVYGASPAFLGACRKADLVPREVADLSGLRGVSVGGSPLPAEMFRWVYEAVGDDVFLQSFSGGTEVCGGFVGGVPMLPVRAGEIACRWLGCKVEVFDSGGRSVEDSEGELVLTEPLPSMPLGLWNDPDGTRFAATYFERYPGAWHHGDRAVLSHTGSVVVSGRSDATLNRGGVRLGTGEFYTVVEALPEIADSLVVHLEDAAGGAGELVLFVVLEPPARLDDALRARIVSDLRRNLSPRHVPDRIEAVPAVPRTLTGKKLEVPVKRILQGAPPETAASRGALADPGALDAYVALARTT
ncbi:MAG: acetoacetate--CoA ligase [Sporichthyaceae bacterium]